MSTKKERPEVASSSRRAPIRQESGVLRISRSLKLLLKLVVWVELWIFTFTTHNMDMGSGEGWGDIGRGAREYGLGVG